MKGLHPSRHTRAFGSFAAAVALAVLASVLLLDPVEVVHSADALPHLPQALGQWWPDSAQP